MKKPIVEIKNLRFFVDGNEGIPPFEAEVFVDGNLWATVGNNGGGEPNSYGIDYAEVKKLNEKISKTYPKYTFYGEEKEKNLDILIEEFIEKTLGM